MREKSAAGFVVLKLVASSVFVAVVVDVLPSFDAGASDDSLSVLPTICLT
jgi:hypothetical protein